MGYNAVMNVMLSWMKWLASWVLGVFNLGGSGFSPLTWLSDNWVRILVILLITGVAADILVWLLRWRPYWVWFNKKRIVINDDNFFAGEDLVDSGLYDPTLFIEPETEKPKRAPEPKRTVTRTSAETTRYVPSTIVKPVRPEPERRKRRPLVERVDDAELEPRPIRAPRRIPRPAAKPAAARRRPPRENMEDPFFTVDPREAINPDNGEDAVFNVSDLPVSKDELAYRHKRK